VSSKVSKILRIQNSIYRLRKKVFTLSFPQFPIWVTFYRTNFDRLVQLSVVVSSVDDCCGLVDTEQSLKLFMAHGQSNLRSCEAFGVSTLFKSAKCA
jgi:hypothetical protein